MGADHAKPKLLGHFEESKTPAYFHYPPNSQKDPRAIKKVQLHQILKAKAFSSIYPSPDSKVIKTKCRAPTKSAPQKVTIAELNAQRAKEENEDAHDERVPVINTAKWPNSVLGLIAGKFDGKNFWGTGIMIGPNIVLTAGHNLYDFHRKIYAELQTLQFLPGMNGQVLPFGVIEVEKFYVSPNYINGEEEEDYGILILKEPIGEITGYFGLACLEPEEIQIKAMNGPGRVAEGWYQEGDNYYIYTGYSHRGGGRAATPLTRAIYKEIYKWLNQKSNKWLFALSNIEKLEFEDFQLDTEHLEFLAQENLECLKTLSFSSKKIGPQGAINLTENKSWINLSMLDLYNNQIGPEGCRALAKNHSWKNLSWLNLNRNNIGTEGAVALARNTSWINLSKLQLENNSIETEGAFSLSQNTSWTKLKYLNLASNFIDDGGAKALINNSAWKDLQFLDLGENDITPEIEAEIARILA